MNKLAKISRWAAIVLGIICAIWLVYNTVQYFDVYKWFEPEKEIFGTFVFIGLIILFFSHIIINLAVVTNLSKRSSNFISGIVLLIFGAVSFIALFFHWGALSDIGKEYPMGLEINNELKAAWLAHILHFSFIIYSLIFLFRNNKIQGKNQQSSLIGEQLFVSLNIIGIVCGITGLLIVLVDFFFRANPESWKWAIIPYSLLVLIPYLLVLSGWSFTAISDKKSGWYDEKQKYDIYKSSTFTLLVSIPAMLLLFLFNFNKIDGMSSILWLPFYLFVILFIFSVSSLYNFKSN